MAIPRTLIIDFPIQVLSLLGRQGSKAIAVLFVISLATPRIGVILKPYVSLAIFILLCLAFLRLNFSALKAHLNNPMLLIVATLWTSVAIPTIVGVGCLTFHVKDYAPELFIALILQATVSPIMAAPAMASLIGLDTTLVIITLISSSALVPLTIPLFANLFLGSAIAISSTALGIKLFAILAGSAFVGLTLRRLIGVATIERQSEMIDGFNILIFYVFLAAIMENVANQFLSAPIIALGLTALAFIVFLVIFLLTTVLFLLSGRERALAFAFVVSQRNVGLILAAEGTGLNDLIWFYFALCQFPIFLSPQVLNPIIRRIRKKYKN